MFIQLFIDTSNTAPDGPGWYVTATDIAANGLVTEYIPRTRISPAEAERLAGEVEKSIDGRTLNWTEGYMRSDQSIVECIKAGTQLAKAAAQKNLDEAEEAAKRVASLRRTLKELENE